MSSLVNQIDKAQSLALFNKVQSKSVLLIAQDDPYFLNDNELILKFGLSLASIKTHLEQLNLSIGKGVLELNEEGVNKLLKLATVSKEGIYRYEAVVKYHKLVDLPTFLKLAGLTVQQLITVINSIIELRGDPQQTMARSMLLKIPNQLIVEHEDYIDGLTEKIHQQLIQKKAH